MNKKIKPFVLFFTFILSIAAFIPVTKISAATTIAIAPICNFKYTVTQVNAGRAHHNDSGEGGEAVDIFGNERTGSYGQYQTCYGKTALSGVDGIVEYVERNNASCGNFIKLKKIDTDGSVIKLIYCHLAEYYLIDANGVKITGNNLIGKKVKRGDVVGTIGRTGNVIGDGIHIHFSVWRNAVQQNYNQWKFIQDNSIYAWEYNNLPKISTAKLTLGDGTKITYQTVKGADNYIYTRSSTDLVTWTPWGKSGQTKNNVTSINFGSKIFQATVGKNQDKIFFRSTDGTTWSNWVEVAGRTTGDIALAEFNGKLYMSLRGTSGTVFTSSSEDQDLSDNKMDWTVWDDEGATKGAVSMVVHEGRLYQGISGFSSRSIFTRSTNNGVTWTPWTTMDGSTSGNVNLGVLGNKLFVSVKGSAGDVYTRYTTDTDPTDLNGTVWEPWQKSGLTKGEISMYTFGDKIFQGVQEKDSESVSIRYSTDGVTWENWQQDGSTSGEVDFIDDGTNLLISLKSDRKANNISHKIWTGSTGNWLGPVPISL